MGISKANNAKEAVGCPGQTFLKVEVGGGGGGGGGGDKRNCGLGMNKSFSKYKGGTGFNLYSLRPHSQSCCLFSVDVYL